MRLTDIAREIRHRVGEKKGKKARIIPLQKPCKTGPCGGGGVSIEVKLL